MLDPLFWQPTRLGVDSTWLEHVPFGHWLVGTYRPASIVELGTRSGVSFSCFCEAVLRCRIDARALAFSPRSGDAATDATGADADLMRFLDRHYAFVATLLHATSDEALQCVADASVDLLHINDAHQQDVSRTFADWVPKLSPRGIVLVNATNLRDARGMWPFWQEISTGYPHFEFFHGEGLGLLAVGEDVDGTAEAICALSDDDAALVRQRFSGLGRHCAVSRELDRACLAEATHDETDAPSADQQATSNAQNTLQDQLARLRATLAARDAQIAALTTENSAEAARSSSLAAEIDRLASSVEAAHAELDAFSQEIIALEHERDALLRSTSWRMTAPLRRLVGNTVTRSKGESVVEPLVEVGKQP